MAARWFRISFAENASGASPPSGATTSTTVRTAEAMGLALDFYRDRRAQHARIRDEGDGLLWQWGPDADADPVHRSASRAS